MELTGQELRQIDAYWRAANYLSVGQIYLYDNLRDDNSRRQGSAGGDAVH